jgi:hypothetical protein
MQFN